MFLFEIEKKDKKDVVSFINKVYSTGHPNPIGSGVIFGLSDKGVSAMVRLDTRPFDGMAHISEFIVLEGLTRKGFGGYMLDEINKQADKAGITLHLTAEPIEVMGTKLPKAKLEAFYKAHGFVKDGGAMIREPK